ncbi:MAG: DNA polymerase III subunit gamma/tau, partial [Nitrospiraceae bacterium]|nr:DNA polymerase III subunit gamma/tau [Nitrospiraceae bacterium]
SRGIGKTTTARILAKALNCLAFDAPTTEPCGECDNCTAIAAGNSMDVIEIDGASNNSVEDVREIRENVRLMPSRSRYKVYIIDEVHQLSVAAFNALLKTLEEPPPHAIFILATTEAHRILATIVSRCQRFDFRRVAVSDICALLRSILDAEGLACSDEALQAIARAAEGGVRDAESILDQLVSYCDGEIVFQDVFDVLGLVNWRVMHELCDAILDKDVGIQLRIVEDIVSSGKDLTQFVQDILRYFRNLLVCKAGDPGTLLALPAEEIAELQARCARLTLTNIIRLVERFAELTKGFDSQIAQRIALEALLISVSKRSVAVNVDTVIEKLLQLSGGAPVAAAPATAPVSALQAPPAPRAQSASSTSKAPLSTEPEALSGPPAPPAPSKPEPVLVTRDNLTEVWRRVAQMAAKDTVALSVGLSQVGSLDLEDDTLILEIKPEAADARELLERGEHRQALETALTALTQNVRTFRSVVGGAPPDQGNEGQTELPISGHVNPDEARAALEDAGVAQVVDVFKGRIVDVKPDASAPNIG